MMYLISQFIILIVLAIFTYFSWWKIEYGVCAIVFFLPFYLVRLNIFGIPTTALEIGIYILFTVWLVKNYCDIFCKHTPSNSPYKGEDKKQIPPLKGEVRWGIVQKKLSLIKEEKTLITGILLLLAGATISTIFSSDIRTSAGILKGWFFDPLLFFIVIISVIKNSDRVENVLKVFSLSGFTVAAISLLYWFGLLPNGVSYDGRLHGFYASPNYLAMYLAPALIIGVWFFLKNNLLINFKFSSCSQSEPIIFDCKGGAPSSPIAIKNKLARFKIFIITYNLLIKNKKYFWPILSIVIVIATYFTYSYAAWLAIFFAIILLFGFTAGVEKKPSFQLKLGFLSIFLVLVILFFSQNGTSKFENLENLAYRSSSNSRLMIWRSALTIGRDYPIFGIGPGNFQKYYLDYQKRFTEPYLEWAVPEPHNIFLAFWLETGILGLTGFILILVWVFRAKIPPNPCLPAGRSLLQREGQKKYPPLQRGIKGDLSATKADLFIVLEAVMAYNLFHGLVDTTYWKNDLAIIFWLILGLMIIVKKIAK